MVSHFTTAKKHADNRDASADAVSAANEDRDRELAEASPFGRATIAWEKLAREALNQGKEEAKGKKEGKCKDNCKSKKEKEAEGAKAVMTMMT